MVGLEQLRYLQLPRKTARNKTKRTKGTRKGKPKALGPSHLLLANLVPRVCISTLISSPVTATSGGGLAGGEEAASPSLWYDGGDGELHPLAASRASFFLVHTFAWAMCYPRQLGHLDTACVHFWAFPT